MTEIETLAIIDHFERKLARYIYNSETLSSAGLRAIYGNKSKMLSLLLYMAKKQIPKKPENVVLTEYKFVWTCPSCKAVHTNEWHGTNRKLPHCSVCGQKLLWESDTARDGFDLSLEELLKEMVGENE